MALRNVNAEGLQFHILNENVYHKYSAKNRELCQVQLIAFMPKSLRKNDVINTQEETFECL